jgi:hypothetical protein
MGSRGMSIICDRPEGWPLVLGGETPKRTGGLTPDSATQVAPRLETDGRTRVDQGAHFEGELPGRGITISGGQTQGSLGSSEVIT